MKILTRIICAGVALAILSACEKKEALTQCATPTLTPPSKTGPANQDIKVTIETKTLGASLSWSDDPTIPPTPTGPHIINGAERGRHYGVRKDVKGDRVQTGIDRFTGRRRSIPSEPVRIATPRPCRWYAKSRPSISRPEQIHSVSSPHGARKAKRPDHAKPDALEDGAWTEFETTSVLNSEPFTVSPRPIPAIGSAHRSATDRTSDRAGAAQE